jgi:hypothetical protein
MNRFEERFAAAEQRRIRRREMKLALKAEGATTGTSSTCGRKPKGAAPILLAPAPSLDLMKLWESMSTSPSTEEKSK